MLSLLWMQNQLSWLQRDLSMGQTMCSSSNCYSLHHMEGLAGTLR